MRQVSDEVARERASKLECELRRVEDEVRAEAERARADLAAQTQTQLRQETCARGGRVLVPAL